MARALSRSLTRAVGLAASYDGVTSVCLSAFDSGQRYTAT